MAAASEQSRVLSLINKTLRRVTAFAGTETRHRPSANPDCGGYQLIKSRTLPGRLKSFNENEPPHLPLQGAEVLRRIRFGNISGESKRETNAGKTMYGIRSLSLSQEHLYWCLMLLCWTPPILTVFLLNGSYTLKLYGDVILFLLVIHHLSKLGRGVYPESPLRLLWSLYQLDQTLKPGSSIFVRARSVSDWAWDQVFLLCSATLARMVGWPG